MNKVIQVAIREFQSTVLTKGFIIGILVTPLIMLVAIFGIGLMMNEEAPRVRGEVAIVDPTGEITGRLDAYLEPEAIAKRRGDLDEQIKQQTPEALRDAGGEQATQAREQALAMILGEVPDLTVSELERSADVEAAKQPLLSGSAESGGRLALVVVHDDAVELQAGEKKYGNYDLFVREKLDDRIEREIREGLYDALVDARVEHVGLDRDQINALTRVGRVRAKTVTAEGERDTNEAMTMLLPAGFMILLLMSVMTGGQYIMTTLVEEKSSRVVEVLLSAVSPMQLMAGKIIGQMAVGFLILAVYSSLGVSGLIVSSLAGYLDFSLLIYLFIFFVIAYFVIGSLMAAVGAAVNEMREAQTLMTPIMIIVIIPWVLWMPISRDPNSVFATVMSFLPPVNSFVMLLRMTSSSPPPLWQVWLSIAIGAASVWAAMWFAAKVFRIGLLMYGKPPNFATLIRWVRMA